MGNRKLYSFIGVCAVILIFILEISSCAVQKKLDNLKSSEPENVLMLAETKAMVPNVTIPKVTRDTLKIVNDDGSEQILMRTRKDEDTGDQVATEMIDAAVVTARFTNVAERKGKVNIAFQIRVPEKMMDSKWQLRFYPDMFYLDDSIRLESVVITGKDYRKAQLRGYEQYNKFINSIINDSTRFINFEALEIFLQRNIPQIYAFKNDTSYVSDEVFYSEYGVSEQDAVDHYTRHHLIDVNEKKKSRVQQVFDKYVKAPIITEGIRLDTVIQDVNGDFIYNYIQTINTRPELKKVEVVLSGEIYEQEKLLYTMPKNDPLVFYISSLAEFTDYRERYLKQVVSRQVEANTSAFVTFEQGKSRVDESLGDNVNEIGRIKECLSDLMGNVTFDLDSIVVSAFASPEGREDLNRRLSRDRSDAISRYFAQYMDSYQKELELERGFSVDESGKIVKEKRVVIPFISRSFGENWETLDFLIRADKVLSDTDKENYFALQSDTNLDRREQSMKSQPSYSYIKDKLYPGLRSVRFNFYLHRKGMVKDTVETTVLDSAYLRGVNELKEKHYEEAVKILGPYGDFNAAVAYVALERNTSAMLILQNLEKTAQVNYLLAVLYSRMGDAEKAVQCYLQSVKQNPSYVHRGNLDPEISILIQNYNLNSYDDSEFDF